MQVQLKGPATSKNPAQSLKFGEDCKIETSSKQLLYITCGVTCDHVILRPFRTLIHEND